MSGKATALRIAHVLAAGEYGGLESVVQSLSAGLGERGHDVRVLAVLDLEPDPHPYMERLARAGVRATALHLPGRAYLRERRALRSWIARHPLDVLHTHGFRADLQAASAGRALGLPVVSTVHGFTGGAWNIRLYERLQERALRRCDAVVAVSHPIAARLRESGVPPGRIHVIQNAVAPVEEPLPRADARRALGLSDDALVAGFVGRLSAEKGADVLLEAVPHLRSRRLEVCLVGDGPQAQTLRERATRLGIAPRVHFAGARASAGRLFSAFDLFVLSSRTEGTPMVLFEAAQSGVPIVAAGVGGVPAVVSPETARLVEPDRPDALALAIDEVLDAPEQAKFRSLAAREQMEREFGREPWLDRYVEIYRTAIA